MSIKKSDIMKKNNKFEQLNKKQLTLINGGGLSDFTNWLVEGVARYWTRKAYDPAYQEADFMVYKM